MFVHRSQDIESMYKQEILSYTQNFEIWLDSATSFPFWIELENRASKYYF